tara:strand:+ start:596 stop:1240 length:645 start_codon:yes stop_codon:yes gene_type:complete
MAKKPPENSKSEKRSASPEEAFSRQPVGLVPLNERLPRGPRGTVHRDLKALIRAEYESGETIKGLAERHGVTARTIHRWKLEERWERSAELASDIILERARGVIRQKVESTEVEVTAAVEGVIARHKAATETLTEMTQEALARAMAYPNEDPFKQLLVIKVASEVIRNVSALDRKTWGLEDRVRTSTTAIYDVLSNMEQSAEVKALRIEEKYEK